MEKDHWCRQTKAKTTFIFLNARRILPTSQNLGVKRVSAFSHVPLLFNLLWSWYVCAHFIDGEIEALFSSICQNHTIRVHRGRKLHSVLSSFKVLLIGFSIVQSMSTPFPIPHLCSSNCLNPSWIYLVAIRSAWALAVVGPTSWSSLQPHQPYPFFLSTGKSQKITSEVEWCRREPSELAFVKIKISQAFKTKKNAKWYNIALLQKYLSVFLSKENGNRYGGKMTRYPPWVLLESSWHIREMAPIISPGNIQVGVWMHSFSHPHCV